MYPQDSPPSFDTPRLDAISAEWLRQRFTVGSAERAREVQHLHQLTMPVTALRAAAVLIPLVLRPTGITVLLTKRTAHLKDMPVRSASPAGVASQRTAPPS